MKKTYATLLMFSAILMFIGCSSDSTENTSNPDFKTDSNLPSYIPTSGLIAYYPFNGNTSDDSGNGNNGIANGATLTNDQFGNENNAYLFNGINNFIQIPNSPSLQNVTAITISSWIYINDWYLSNNLFWFPIISKSSSTSAGLFSLGTSMNVIYSNLLSKQGELKQNKIQKRNWYNLVVVADGNSTSFYINGILYGTTSSFINLYNTVNTDPLFIGKDLSGKTEFANGKIDDIGIWNRALTTQEISNLYNGKISSNIPPNIPKDGLVAYYPFNGNADDFSGNDNDGIVKGATLINDRTGKINSAYDFDGLTNYIVVPNALISNTVSSYSISLWFRINKLVNSNGNPPILISDRSTGLSSYKYTINMNASDKTINSAIYNGLGSNTPGQGIATKTINDNNWHNVMMVFDSGQKLLKQYVDGTLIGTYNNVTQWSNNSNPTYIGMWNGYVGFSGYFNGQIDDVGIWNRSLTDNEITNLYNSKN